MTRPVSNRPTREEIVERMRTMSLAEHKEGKLQWWWISAATVQAFQGVFIVRAVGPTNALRIVHEQAWMPPNSETQQFLIPDDFMVKIPEDFRWRKLSKAEAESLGG